jgi:hypothetical protein
VDLMNTTGCTVWQTEKAPTRYTHSHSGAVGGRLPMGPASQFTTSRALHRDDSDHVLMRMTIPGHLVKRKSKTKTTVSWRLTY